MAPPMPHDVTQLLRAWSDGQQEAFDKALKALTAFDPRKSRVVELRFFGGLSIEEAAEVL